MRTLLLWDIDGTLIDSGGAGERALRLALEREFNIRDDLSWLEYFGRTDVWIARTLLEHHRVEPTTENIHRFLGGYLRALEEQMNNAHARLLPGIGAILQAVAARTDVAQGLLTGNLQRGARIKLGHFSIWEHFPFGAFADDSETRDELGPHAVRRASLHHGVAFGAERVYVIGDTPHDVACGKIIGARTIAVATGRYTADDLRTHNPSFVFDDLGDVGAFLAQVCPPPPAAG